MKADIKNLCWDTAALYPSPDATALERDFEDIAFRVREFRKQYLGMVASLSAEAFRDALISYEELHEFIAKPQCYAYLLFAADSGDDTNKRLSQRAAEFGNLTSRELLFFDLEIIQMEDSLFQAFLADPLLCKYRHYLESIRKFRLHTLTEQEENLLKQKSLTGTDAFSRLFDELSASFTYSMGVDGEERIWSGEELLALLHHPEAETRERAFSLFLERHGEHAIVFTAVFNNITLDHSQELELRKYHSPMEPTNLGNELPANVVERLMTVSESNYQLARTYFQLKAQILNMTRLKNSDIYAPVEESSRRFSFGEAKALVLDAYGQASSEFRDIIAEFFTERRIDVLPRPGKSGGAFCMGVTPHSPPYVLLNFTGNLRDVATLAHELGHGLHFVLAGRQSMLNYHPPLPLSETASVFGEMLLTRHLLERETDRSVKVALLCAKIEDIIATTFRQNVLTRFEERIHLERQRGLLTTSRICDLWWEENDRLYGTAVEMIPSYRWGWSYISHFIHSRFYCYSYVFAELLVLSLYRKYVDEGDSFIPVYREMLCSGSSRSPVDTVAPAGIDLTAPDFWQKGYDYLGELIHELEGLL